MPGTCAPEHQFRRPPTYQTKHPAGPSAPSSTACPLARSDRLDGTVGTERTSEATIGREQYSAKCLGERHVHGVPPPHRCSQLPRPGEQASVAEALSGPGLEILDRLTGLGAV